MFEAVIHLIANAIAKQIQRGSPTGAFIGAAAGAFLATLATFLMARADMLGAYRYPMYIILGVPGSIIGSLLGAWLWPRPRAPVGAVSIRITNYSRVIRPFVIAALLVGLIITVVIASSTPVQAQSKLQILVLAAIVAISAIVAVFAANRELLYLEVGRHVTIRTLLGARLYQLNQIRNWGFEISRGRLEREPFDGVANLLLHFEDGSNVIVVTPGGYSAAIIAILKSAQPLNRH